VSIVRADKLLLRVAVERSRGVGQTDYDKQAIAQMLRDLGVDLIVYQPGFWEDLRQMARFASVLHMPDFEQVSSFDITGNISQSDNNIVEIYRPTYHVEHTNRTIQLDMPIIRDKFQGPIGRQ
ncbi:MAG: hypothetical protein WAN51_11045, partial [Alphaproteobacteria bacterium]